LLCFDHCLLQQNRDGRALIYTFVQTKAFKTQQNILVVELDASGNVVKSDFNQIGQF